MKFVYEYRTTENVLQRGILSAATRDEVFKCLKSQGIRPSRVIEAPGVMNKLFGKGKRWIGICILSTSFIALYIIYLETVEERNIAIYNNSEITSEFDSPIRRQIIGDTAIIEKGIRTGWEEVFPFEGERFLASFAIPGVPAGLRNTCEEEILKALDRSAVDSSPSYQPNSEYDFGTSLEARQIIAIVEGMKQELREFIAGKKHTIFEYGQRLVQRQEQEIAYYNRAKAEIDAAVAAKMPRKELTSLWESRNAQLRKIGVKLVPMPED